MDILYFDKDIISNEIPANRDGAGYIWIDASHDEVAQDSREWQQRILDLTGINLYDLHLKDILNLSHPSHFDLANQYQLLIFRKLSLTVGSHETSHIPAALKKLSTSPVSFVMAEKVLITIHADQSRIIEGFKARLMDQAQHQSLGSNFRLPVHAIELMLRLLNAMVDQYLELRNPLTSQLDHWQHALLDPRRPFNNWIALLDSRVEIRKLENLSEEQHDAIQELKDYLIDSYEGKNLPQDATIIRLNDVLEHITRVLNHARRLETSLESAVQIHFAAMAHQTNDIVRTLTVLTALFMPLTLITGIFGMNFEYMPLIKQHSGFLWTLIGMALIVVVMLIFFISKRYLDRSARRVWRDDRS